MYIRVKISTVVFEVHFNFNLYKVQNIYIYILSTYWESVK